MSEPPCEQICNPTCAATCPGTMPPSIALSEALARFEREAVQRSTPCPHFVWGNGPPLLFVHGAADNRLSFVLPSAQLSRTFRCIAYDLSAGTTAELFAVLDAVEAKQAYVYGAGLGASIVLAALHARPDRLPRAVLQGASARKRLSLIERLGAGLLSCLPGTLAALPLRRQLTTSMHHRSFADRPPELWEHYLATTGTLPTRAVGRRARLLHTLDLRPVLGEIRQPILLLNGADDSLVSPEATRELLAGLSGAGEVLLENCGHLPHFTQPEVLARLVQVFLTPPTPCPDHPHDGGNGTRTGSASSRTTA